MINTSPAISHNYMEMLRPRIDAALESYCGQQKDCPARLLEAMRYSLLAPGKRLRPILSLLAAEACGGSTEAAMPAACAVEMVHAYSLIHDDLPAMDNDDLRRGRLTCHKAFDEATAILAGDALLSLAFEVLAIYVHPPAVASACCGVLAKAAGACNLVGGQADDIYSATAPGTEELFFKGHSLSDNSLRATDAIAPGAEELLKAIHRRKTGALIRASIRLGGMTSKADADQLALLDQYGQNIGLAFQIVDDLLDIHGNEQSLGKRVGKDAKQGKFTFPGILGIDRSARYAAELIEKACETIVPFGDKAAGLDALARYVLKRNC